MRETLLGKRGRAALLLLGMIAGTIVVLIVYAVVATTQKTEEIRTTQLEGTPTGKRLLESSDRILDCTEPGDEDTPAGQCYKRSQRQTAQILSSAQRIIILSAACSADLDPTLTVDQRVTAITGCVVERLTNR